MIRVLYDKIIDGAPIPNCAETNGMSVHNNMLNHFDNFGIPYRCININQVTDNTLTLYPVEPQDVFDIMHPAKPGFIETVSKEAIKCIQNTGIKSYLLIWFPTEGFSLTLFNNSIPRYIKLIQDRYSIPKHKILFVYGDVNIKESGKPSKLFDFLPAENVFGLNIFEHVSVGDFSNQKKPTYKDVIFRREYRRDKKKLFLFKNGNIRPHRIYLITELHKMGILNQSYYSWINHSNAVYSEEDYKRIFWHYIKNEVIRDEYIAEYKTKIEKNIPIVLDKVPSELVDRANQIKLDNNFILNSYFTLVTETVPDNENFGIQFFSEKIYQPLQTLHPFIVYGCAGSLEYLHNQGYATFPDLFNEDYDKIKNEAERGKFIANEIKRVSLLEKKKLNEIIYSDYMVDKLRHNQKLIQSQPAKNGYYQLMNWFETIFLN